MAKSERLQFQKLREDQGSDDRYALVLFEDAGKYSVVAEDQIKEEHYAYGQTVNVLWGKGRTAQYYKAKLMMCGPKEDCEKEAFDISSNTEDNSTQDTEKPDTTGQERSNERKRKRENGHSVTSKKSRETDSQCATASWQASIEEEQKKLAKAVESSYQKESLSRHLSSKHVQETESCNGLSDIVRGLQVLDGKVDLLLKQGREQNRKLNTMGQSRSETSSPTLKAESQSSSFVESGDETDDENSSDFVFNDIDLLGLKAPPKEPTRYGTHLAGVLFSKEELLDGMLPPVNTKLGRKALDPEKVLLIKRCIVKKYSQKTVDRHWNEIRRAINQKCND